MRKNKIIIFALIVLFVVSVVSIRLNSKNAAETENLRINLIGRAYSDLYVLSYRLGDLLNNIERGEANDKINRDSLIFLSYNFVRLDAVLKQYASFFTPKGIVRNVYTGFYDFDFIASTLTVGGSIIADIPYEGILVDNAISENEIRYLEALRDDISLIVSAMVSSDDPPNENQNLTVYQMDEILNTFFSKWSFRNEECPYFLLQSESQRELRGMTLNELRAIAVNIGSDLTMNDLRDYAVDDLGEGFYGYRIIGAAEPYNLLVASDNRQTILYTKFYNVLAGGGLSGDTAEAIDVRYYDIDKFITDGTQELVHPLP